MEDDKIKLTVKGLAGALLIATILAMATGGGVIHLDPDDEFSVWMTVGRYKKLIGKLKEEFEAGNISVIDVLYGASDEMHVYRAILDREAKHGAFEGIEVGEESGFVAAMIRALEP